MAGRARVARALTRTRAQAPCSGTPSVLIPGTPRAAAPATAVATMKNPEKKSSRRVQVEWGHCDACADPPAAAGVPVTAAAPT